MTSENVCRETIAKLMANENIEVTHVPSATTASFDVKNRVLILPVWNESDESVYTLLISHEVGHALFTPIDELIDVLKTHGHIKSIINVVEDARIEKLIQQKYPGIKYQFRKGYGELFKKNFFNTDGRGVDSYNLIDRLNLHFKVGGFGYHSVSFSSDESQWVDKIESCKTFSEVVNVSIELYEYLKSEQETASKSQKDDLKISPENDSSQPTESSDTRSNVGENKDGFSSNDVEQNSNSSSDIQPDSSDSANQSGNEFESETQKSFEQNLSDKMVDNCSSYYKLTVPEIKLNDIIVGYKDIHLKISDFYKNSHFDKVGKLNEFKRRFTLNVNSMANIFEMKKSADLHSRASIAKTGQLNMNKIHSYRYDDNIFKKISIIPEGKSHGLVMFFDMSSSMDKVISSCIEQILILCMFCKKINIPFEVYGFSDNSYSYESVVNYYGRVNELKISSAFKLRNYLSSKMTNVEYDLAFGNMIQLAEYYSDFSSYIPHDDRLGSTPLIPCILSSKKIISKFKVEYGLDIVNAIYLTDGDDTHGIISDSSGKKLDRYYSTCKIVVKSDKSNREYVIKSPNDTRFDFTTNKLLKLVKDETNANIISFYLVHGNIERIRHLMKQGYNKERFDQFYKANNFCEVKNHLGYDSFYFIRSTTLNMSESKSFDDVDADIDYEDAKQLKQNIKKIARSFDKHMSNVAKNKLFLNKFIEQIA